MIRFLKLFDFVRSTDVVVSPPFVYIDWVKNSITDNISMDNYSFSMSIVTGAYFG